MDIPKSEPDGGPTIIWNRQGGKLKAPETGNHRRTVTVKYFPYCRNAHAVYTQVYDSKMMFKEQDMQLCSEVTDYGK